MDDGFTFFVQTYENSLLKNLIDLGYECWITSSRGTRYSFEHESMTDKDSDFWGFTWDDMVDYDLPALVDFIK